MLPGPRSDNNFSRVRRFHWTFLFDVDQRKAQFRLFLSHQMGGGFGQGNFQCRADMAFDEMAAAGVAVGQTQHGMCMQTGGDILIFGNVAHQGDDLDLFVHRDGQVFFLFPVEIADHSAFEGAQRDK